MDPTTQPGRPVGTPIPDLVVLSEGTNRTIDPWMEQIWPPPGEGALQLQDFVPVRHVCAGSATVGATQEPSAHATDRILTVVMGRVAAAWVDLRSDRRPHPNFVTELAAGSSVFVPAGVAFGYQVLAAPVVLSLDESATRGDSDLGQRRSPDSAPGIAWPIPVPLTGTAMSPSRGPGRPYRVIFVCTGNICRSAYAQAAANARPHEGIEFSSAGVQALVGHPIDPPMAACLPPEGDASDHRARQLTRQEMLDADLVIAMAAEHRRYILEEWPDLGRKTFVLGHVAREVDAVPTGVTLDELTDFLWRHRTTDPDDEVPDPYRRGPDAARAAARKIDGFLDALIPGLVSLPHIPQR